MERKWKRSLILNRQEQNRKGAKCNNEAFVAYAKRG